MGRLERAQESEVTCARCGRVVDTRLQRYAFVLVAWRGRTIERLKDPDRRLVLCGPCGQELTEVLLREGYAVGHARDLRAV